MFSDLREFIVKCEQEGQFRKIEGADWNLELGVLTEIEAQKPHAPLLLFDKITGYPAGYRVAVNLFADTKRMAWLIGRPPVPDFSETDLIRLWKERLKEGINLLPPREVDAGPVKENIHLDGEVDLWEFPVPRWHELDGGRYIGTGDLVITRDPDTGWVNLGTYRVQVQDQSTVTIHMSPGRHGELIAQKYWDKGQACPVAISCGQEPTLWSAASASLHQNVDEYAWAGGVRGEAVAVTKGVVTGLPVPATAEIVLEGDFLPPEEALLKEGPFGEWPGHYGQGRRGGCAPIVKVKGVMHRDDPILLGAPPLLFAEHNVCVHIPRAAVLWDELEKQVPGVRGVSLFKEAGAHHIAVISLEQKYPGHAKQAAMMAAGLRVSAYMLKFVIVVDEDIDPSNIREVLWALGSRTDPEVSIDVVRGCWGSQTDPFVSPQKRAVMDYTHGIAIILACKPYHYLKDFPPTIRTSPELLRKVTDKWAGIL